MDRHNDLVVALTPLLDVPERLEVAWYVGGSVVSTVHGRFRATNAVDVIAELREEHASQIRMLQKREDSVLHRLFAPVLGLAPPGIGETLPHGPTYPRHLRSGLPTMTSCSSDTSISPIRLST